MTDTSFKLKVSGDPPLSLLGRSSVGELDGWGGRVLDSRAMASLVLELHLMVKLVITGDGGAVRLCRILRDEPRQPPDTITPTTKRRRRKSPVAYHFILIEPLRSMDSRLITSA